MKDVWLWLHAMEACAIAKAKRRPSWALARRAELNPAWTLSLIQLGC